MLYRLIYSQISYVALLAEGVDRNRGGRLHRRPAQVALLAEGVDRNYKKYNMISKLSVSPSSRRAWIEIP